MQTHPVVIPAVDPIPLPGPVWLFWALLILTFLLHTLAMNCVVGGTVISLVTRFRHGSPFYARLAGDLARKIPSFLAATITLGVAPLLFVQVLYGRFFYTSSVLMAWVWLSVVGLLIVGYYASYAAAFRAEGSRSRLPSAVALVTFLAIAFIYTSNFTLMLTPQKWVNKYLANSAGLNLNLDEPMLWPRLAHTLVAALAVAGLLVVILALTKWKKDPAYSRFLLQHGALWFIVPTMLQFVVGAAYVVTLPRDKMMLYMGGDRLATALLAGSLVMALVAVLLMLLALRSEAPQRTAIASIGLAGLTLICMVLMRDVLRNAYLKPYVESPEVRVQWSVVVLFLVLFVGSLALWGMMLRKYFARA